MRIGIGLPNPSGHRRCHPRGMGPSGRGTGPRRILDPTIAEVGQVDRLADTLLKPKGRSGDPWVG